MFENLLHQNRIKNRLINDISSGSVPQSILFSGPEYSGKYTAALELVRVLNCHQDGAPWDCSCSSCKAQRLLIHPDTLFLGKSHFSVDIQAALDLMERRDAPASRYMLIRNVRKLLRRFDPVLWEGNEKKVQKVGKTLEDLNQILMDIAPGRELPKKWEKVTKDILKFSLELEKQVPISVPINQIRRINHWSHLGSQGQDVRKAVIIDKADQMQEGARNALLKLLEEPPEDVYLILLSNRKKRILPTILSRLRCYDFAARDSEASEVIQKRIFKEENPSPSLREYFNQYTTSQGDGSGAARFLMALYEGETSFPEEVFEKYDKEELPLFYQDLLVTLRKWMHLYDTKEYPSIGLSTLERWNSAIRQSYNSMESLNLNGNLMLEDLYYRLRDHL